MLKKNSSLSVKTDFFLRFYLFIHERHREREREADTQVEGEADSMQGARHGTRSQVSRITPWAEGGTKPLSHQGCPAIIPLNILFKVFIYSFMKDTEREVETQEEGEAGSTQGAQCGTRSRDFRIMPWAEGRCLTAEPPRHLHTAVSYTHLTLPTTCRGCRSRWSPYH